MGHCSTIRGAVLSALLILLVLIPPAALAQSKGVAVQGREAPPANERRIALVIGNGAYETGPLRNPVNDARAIADKLRSLDFEVIALENATQRDMKRAMFEFGRRLRESKGVGLFYYSGHGIQVSGTNYMLPVGARIEVEQHVELEGIAANRVLKEMEAAGNRLNIVILDACRNNPFARSFRSAEQGLARMDAPTGTLLAYATSPGDVAADGEGGHSPYTGALLEHLNTPGLKIEENFKRVRTTVMAATGKRQTPWESSSLTGDFYFARAAGQSPVTAAVPRPPGDSGFSLDDIAEAARREKEGREAWDRHLSEMKAAYAQVEAIDRENVSPQLKQAGWERFLAAFTQDDPYSSEDEALRARAGERLRHWEGEQRRLAEEAERRKQQAAISTRPTGNTWREPVTGMEFVAVPGGSYEQGCGPWTGDCRDNEMPSRRVTLSPFWLGRTEVTQRQWKRVMGSNPSRFQGDDRPVELVSWNDTQAFIRRLNVQSRGVTFRLPTEAEWEYACRAGGKPVAYGTPTGRLDSNLAKYDSADGTVAVGSFPPNALGAVRHDGQRVGVDPGRLQRHGLHGRLHQRSHPCGFWRSPCGPGRRVVQRPALPPVFQSRQVQTGGPPQHARFPPREDRLTFWSS